MDKFPLGAAFNKGISSAWARCTARSTSPPCSLHPPGEVDPSFVLTHRFLLDEIPHAYEVFKNKAEGCVKVLVKVV